MARRPVWYVTTPDGDQIVVPSRAAARAYVAANGGAAEDYRYGREDADTTSLLSVLDLADNNQDRMMGQTLYADLRLATASGDEDAVIHFTEGLQTLQQRENGEMESEEYADAMRELYEWALDNGYIDKDDDNQEWFYHHKK